MCVDGKGLKGALSKWHWHSFLQTKNPEQKVAGALLPSSWHPVEK